VSSIRLEATAAARAIDLSAEGRRVLDDEHEVCCSDPYGDHVTCPVWVALNVCLAFIVNCAGQSAIGSR
jgi:hypothetical protein